MSGPSWSGPGHELLVHWVPRELRSGKDIEGHLWKKCQVREGGVPRLLKLHGGCADAGKIMGDSTLKRGRLHQRAEWLGADAVLNRRCRKNHIDIIFYMKISTWAVDKK